MEEINIQTMTKADIGPVRDLWIKTGFELSYSDQPSELERMINHNPDLCLVLLRKSEIIGCLLGGFDGRRGWIHHLAIHPEYQQNHFGTLLMKEITKRFQSLRVGKIKIEILETNQEVIQFYLSLGWSLRSELSTMSLTLNE